MLSRLVNVDDNFKLVVESYKNLKENWNDFTQFRMVDVKYAFTIIDAIDDVSSWKPGNLLLQIVEANI